MWLILQLVLYSNEFPSFHIICIRQQEGLLYLDLLAGCESPRSNMISPLGLSLFKYTLTL